MSTNTPGSYVEAKIEHIDDGKMKEDLDKLMQRAFRELSDYLEEMDEKKGKASFGLKCTLEQTSKEFVTLNYEMTLNTPGRKSSAMVRGAGKRLLAQPEPDSLNDNDQLLLYTFDKTGSKKATINTETGEVVDDDTAQNVAGSINTATG